MRWSKLFARGGACVGAALVWSMACSSAEGSKIADDNGSGGSSSGATGGTGSLDDASTGGTGGGSADSGFDGNIDSLRDAACADRVVEPESLPAVLQLVIDTSGSMGRVAPNTSTDDTKWEITHSALLDAIAALPGSVGLGMMFYPNKASGANPTCNANITQQVTTWERESCEPEELDFCVDVSSYIAAVALGATDSPHRQSLQASLDEVNPDGGTPTHDAYLYALEQFRGVQFPGDKFMVLITDGQPTYERECIGTGQVNQDPPSVTQPIVDSIAAARTDDNIRTFLIGSPGSEESAATGMDLRPWLSEAAQVGGTGSEGCSVTGPNYCHFDMSTEADFATGLRDALTAIVGQVVSCKYAIPDPGEGETIDENKIIVVYTPGGGEPDLVPRSVATECATGWQLVDNGAAIEFCPETCDLIQADSRAALEVIIGCQGDIVVE